MCIAMNHYERFMSVQAVIGTCFGSGLMLSSFETIVTNKPVQINVDPKAMSWACGWVIKTTSEEIIIHGIPYPGAEKRIIAIQKKYISSWYYLTDNESSNIMNDS